MSKIKIFALGGLNENGKNMYVVEVDQDIFVFDAGLKYADDKMLGVDYIIPNYDYLKENKKRIKGFFITHGHDSQMGAIPDIIEDFKEVPIYGTRFTLEIIKQELEEEKITANNLKLAEPHRSIKFGKNSIFPISLTHSVPDTVGYVLYTPDGAIFYTGNFVFDPTLIGAYQTDIGKLAYVGKQGVLCLLSESLYADRPGFTSPKHRIAKFMSEALNKCDGRILCNVSSSGLTRIQEIFTEVSKTDRSVVILGKRLESTIMKAIDLKLIDFDKNRIANIHQANQPNSFILVADEREKPYSNMGRIVKGYDRFVKITSDDHVIFTSPVEAGQERRSTKLFDEIARISADLMILPSKQYLGYHASREDLLLMLGLMNPTYYFPVIGEYRHQVENAKAAMAVGMQEDHILTLLNGQVAVFENGVLQENREKMKIDEILIDGKQAGDVGELVLKDRELLSENGIVIVSVTLDRSTKEVVSGPEILTRGFIYVKDHIDLIKEAERISLEVIEQHTKDHTLDFNKIKSGLRDKLGKYLYQETECKPMILIVLQEV